MSCPKVFSDAGMYNITDQIKNNVTKIACKTRFVLQTETHKKSLKGDYSRTSSKWSPWG